MLTPRFTGTSRHTRARSARGFVLIEALIAMLIFSLGVLGLVGLQVSLTRASTSAKFRADAVYLANDIVGTMWADAVNLANYSNCISYTPCKNWADKVAATLPSGTPSLSICTTCNTVDSLGRSVIGEVTITISWTVPDEGSHSFTTTTSINPNT